MGRRKELKSVCNDLLDNFVSRYNDLDGYWAVGKFQAFLHSNPEDKLRFCLSSDDGSKNVFPQTLNYYRSAFERHLKVRGISKDWVAYAVIVVEQRSSSQLLCSLTILNDKGRAFEAWKLVSARLHDPLLELQRCGKHGPQNQKGI